MGAPGSGLGWRHMQVALMFMCVTAAITIRAYLSVAIVVMTDEKRIGESDVIRWSPIEKSAVMGSFLFGYMLTQVVGGSLSARGGATRWLAGSLVVGALLTVISPTLALLAEPAGWISVAVCRALTGLVQGMVFPTCFTLLGRWTPPEERGRAGAIILAAQPMGNILAMALSGIIAKSWGWPAVFYVFGAANLVIAGIWLWLGANHPDLHPWISMEERKFISESIGTLAQPKQKFPVPWLALCKCGALWSLAVAHLAYAWGFWVALTAIPSYLKQVLDVDIVTNGLLSSLPYVAMLLTSVIFGWAADVVEKRQWLSLTLNRKICNTIGEWIPAALLVVLGFWGSENPVLAIGLLTVAVGLISGCFSGCLINYVDLTPNFSGIVFGIGNTVASLVSAFAPFSEGVFVDKNDPLPGWRTVFLITAGIFFFFNLVWLIWGSADEQTWNNPERPPRSRQHSLSGPQITGYDNPALVKI